jgi:hypothetical protein
MTIRKRDAALVTVEAIAIGFVLVLTFLPQSLPSATNTKVSSTTASTSLSNSGSSLLPESYTVNGLTCPFYVGTPQNVLSLVQNITRDSRFLTATYNGQFMLGNFENNSGEIQIIGENRTFSGTTVHHPAEIELVFYGTESGTTTCQRSANQYVNVVVHVPIQGGRFNVTGADFHCDPVGPWCPPTINIATVNSRGIPNIGYHITLWENGVQIGQIGTCFSYCFFFVTNGQTYQVGAGSNGSETFSFWNNDGSTGLETVSVPASNNQSYAGNLEAVYSP